MVNTEHPFVNVGEVLNLINLFNNYYKFLLQESTGNPELDESNFLKAGEYFKAFKNAGGYLPKNPIYRDLLGFDVVEFCSNLPEAGIILVFGALSAATSYPAGSKPSEQRDIIKNPQWYLEIICSTGYPLSGVVVAIPGEKDPSRYVLYSVWSGGYQNL